MEEVLPLKTKKATLLVSQGLVFTVNEVAAKLSRVMGLIMCPYPQITCIKCTGSMKRHIGIPGPLPELKPCLPFPIDCQVVFSFLQCAKPVANWALGHLVYFMDYFLPLAPFCLCRFQRSTDSTAAPQTGQLQRSPERTGRCGVTALSLCTELHGSWQKA